MLFWIFLLRVETTQCLLCIVEFCHVSVHCCMCRWKHESFWDSTFFLPVFCEQNVFVLLMEPNRNSVPWLSWQFVGYAVISIGIHHVAYLLFAVIGVIGMLETSLRDVARL